MRKVGDENNHVHFDVIIGNPPYQEEAVGDQKNYAPPIYDKFMSAAYEVGDVVELITPARFLFNAGGTPKAWNKKVLADEHFKVLKYEPDGKKVFPAAEIKGGVAITYHDNSKVIGPIGTFIPFDELRSVYEKVRRHTEKGSVADIIANRGECHISDVFMSDYPDWRELVGDTRFMPAMFDRFPDAFHDERPDDGREYVKMLGLVKNRRYWKYVRRDYIRDTKKRIGFYKVYVPKANGNGRFGEVISNPVLGGPDTAPTESFVSMGAFSSEFEARACLDYLKTKFFRAMLSILKVTQNSTYKVYACVPLQDFTADSDIDWTKTIPEIDEQLYDKYDLTQEERDFIETNVKPMQ